MTSRSEYVFREGELGDRNAVDWADQTDIPTFVLEFQGKQVGAAHGSNCFMIMIQVFEENKGHGTKFIEMWEEHAKMKGCSEIEVSVVGNPKLDHILKDKRGFTLKEVDEYSDRVYNKIL